MIRTIFIYNSEIQSDYLIPIRRPGLVLINKNKRPLKENQRKRKDGEIPGPFQGTKKAEKHEGDGDTICSWTSWKVTKGLKKKLEKE